MYSVHPVTLVISPSSLESGYTHVRVQTLRSFLGFAFVSGVGMLGTSLCITEDENGRWLRVGTSLAATIWPILAGLVTFSKYVRELGHATIFSVGQALICIGYTIGCSERIPFLESIDGHRDVIQNVLASEKTVMMLSVVFNMLLGFLPFWRWVSITLPVQGTQTWYYVTLSRLVTKMELQMSHEFETEWEIVRGLVRPAYIARLEAFRGACIIGRPVYYDTVVFLWVHWVIFAISMYAYELRVKTDFLKFSHVHRNNEGISVER